MCPSCRAFISASDRTCPYCEAPVGQRAIDRRMPGEILGGLIPHARFTTVMILLVNAGMFVATIIFSMRAGNENAIMGIDGRTLIDFGAKYRPGILLGGEWWRLVTAGFLHGGLLHIAMNSWALFDLGTQVEEIYGTSRLIVFYFLSSVFGFLASTWWSPSISMGASAALFGLIGAMIAIGVRHKTSLGAHIRAQYVRWAVYGLIFGLLPGIDNAAHLGGLAAGFGCAYVAGLPRLESSPSEKLWRLAAAACLLLTIVSFLKMYISFAANNR